MFHTTFPTQSTKENLYFLPHSQIVHRISNILPEINPSHCSYSIKKLQKTNYDDCHLWKNAIKTRDPMMTNKHVCTEEEPLQPSSEQ